MSERPKDRSRERLERRAEERRERKRRRRRRRRLIIAASVLVLIGAVAAGGYLYEKHRTGSIYHPHARFVAQPTPTLPQKPPEGSFDWPNYGYTLNSQRYALNGNVSSTAAYSHEATAAYVWRMPLRRVTPFALAGAGSLVFDPKDIAGDALARPLFVYGAGADFDLGSHWFLRAQYRGLVYNSPILGASTVAAELLTHRAEPSAGFGFRF